MRRRQFLKLCFFTLFLTYPSISSSILSYWVCKPVGNQYYLVTDFSLFCYDDLWWHYLPFAVIMAIIYPCGVPFGFFLLLWSNRGSLASVSVKQRLGFLYEAYFIDVWWFELVDMIHKLFLTSILLFFSSTFQLPIALIAVIGYLMIILLKSPYVHRVNDRFHMLVQTTLFCILLSASVLQQTNQIISGAADILLSTILIILTIWLVLLCLIEIFKTFRNLYRYYQRFTLEKLNSRIEEENQEEATRSSHSLSGLSHSQHNPEMIDMASTTSNEGTEGSTFFFPRGHPPRLLLILLPKLNIVQDCPTIT